MVYDEKLAARVRKELDRVPDLQEKKMFGGVGFLIRGNLACGVNGDDLIVRVGAENTALALVKPATRPFAMTGRPMAGWIMVGPAGCQAEGDLQAWLEQGIDCAKSLPAK